MNKAIDDAIVKLKEKFPNSVSSKIITSGFVAVGISYFYVIMEQQ